MKKRLALVSLLSIMTISSIPAAPAFAHVLQQNNGVSAVLHIAPDDNPVAGQKTLIDVDFSSATSSFSFNEFKPTLTLKQQGKTLSKTSVQPAFFGASSEGVATVVFPQVGTYDVIVAGSTGAAKSTFSLDYTERVATGQSSGLSGTGLQIIIVSVASFVLLAAVAYTYIQQGQRYKMKTPKA